MCVSGSVCVTADISFELVFDVVFVLWDCVERLNLRACSVSASVCHVQSVASHDHSLGSKDSLAIQTGHWQCVEDCVTIYCVHSHGGKAHSFRSAFINHIDFWTSELERRQGMGLSNPTIRLISGSLILWSSRSLYTSMNTIHGRPRTYIDTNAQRCEVAVLVLHQSTE